MRALLRRHAVLMVLACNPAADMCWETAVLAASVLMVLACKTFLTSMRALLAVLVVLPCNPAANT
jgi:hypothetical protein